MARKLRTTTTRDLIEIGIAIEQLRGVRERLKAAGARQAARYVAAALKSVEGAQRHAKRAQA